MELHVYMAFVVATAIMLALPGPSVILNVAHSISFGWQRALVTVAGTTTGIAVQLMVVIIGLASLLNMVAQAFEWLRWLGAAYLIYLGIKQWRSASQPVDFDATTVSKTSLFVQGVAITIPNPKSLIFIAAFLPQFIDATRPLAAQFAIIVPTFLLLTFCVTAFWVIIAAKIRGFLKSQRAFRSMLRTAGGMMIVAGVGLALSRRSS